MNRNQATIGMFLAAGILGGAFLGTGVAPQAFGAGVNPQQATAATWSLWGGIGAAIGGLFNLFRPGGNVSGIKNVLKLVAQLLPYRESLAPQELVDAIFAVLDWRFRGNPEAVKLVDQLVQFDMEMSRRKVEANDSQINELRDAVDALTKKFSVGASSETK